MAIWKYHFNVLPAKYIQAFTEAQLSTLHDEGLHGEDAFWSDSGILRYAFHDIKIILPAHKSWSNNIDQYGNLESNCFEVLYDKSRVESVSFRIDFTSNFDNILTYIVEFCVKHGLTILGDECRRMPDTLDGIKDIIYSSSNATTYQKLSTPNNNL